MLKGPHTFVLLKPGLILKLGMDLSLQCPEEFFSTPQRGKEKDVEFTQTYLLLITVV